MGAADPELLGAADRILVVGPCGAGKSRFARRLAVRRGLPLVHLDRLYWRPGWQPAEAAEWQRAVRDAVGAPRWIVDGTFASTLELRLARAELVVHLDYPRRLYLWRILRRIAGSWHRVRPSMADGCREHLDLAFLAYAWTFGARQRPVLLRAVEGSGVPELRFARPAEAARALRRLGVGPTPGERGPGT